MQVIFTKNSEHGKIDEVKEVADGLAKNLLIKKGFAISATKEALAVLKRKKDKESVELKEWENNVNSMISILTEKVFSIKRESSSKEKINGSLTHEDIVKEIKDNFNIDIDKKMIKSDKINRFGLNDLVIDFGHGKKCSVTISLERTEKK